ncbi:predicted protein [Paecilomyces variotii No. 5]|uniref:Cytochrome P450 n=1 Tax=Byssochlamys spectabilis (strain No. 5 / NBRC 109023) TaxID=1356009 RepID=V5G338_BYSSN|nr:predicted protein [Paecilomyces variotii No. 5]
MGLLENAAAAVIVFLLVLLGFCVFIILCKSFYRVYLSNLTGIPGPWFAKATGLYEFCQDWRRFGRYSQMVELLHARKGKIIRISPHTVSIADASVYRRYLLGRRDFEWPDYPDEDIVIRPSQLQMVPAGNISNDYLSPDRLFPLEPLILRKYAGFLHSLDQAQAVNNPLRMHMMFFSLAASVMKACYLKHDTPRTDVYGLQGYEYPCFAMDTWYVSSIKSLFRSIARKVRAVCGPGTPNDVTVIRCLFNGIRNPPVVIDGFTQNASQYILNDFIRTTQRPPTYRWMSDKDTVLDLSVRLSRALTVLFNQLFHDSARLAILRHELSTVLQEHALRPVLRELGTLPYLNSCVREALRLSEAMDNCIIHYENRSSWELQDGHFTWKIPQGTYVRFSAKILFHDPHFFPDSRSFRPERFIETPVLKDLFDQFTRGMEVTVATMLLSAAFLFRSYATAHLEPVSCVGWFDLHAPYYQGADRELFWFGGFPLVAYEETSLQHVIRPRRFTDQEADRVSLDITDLRPEVIIFGEAQ